MVVGALSPTPPLCLREAPSLSSSLHLMLPPSLRQRLQGHVLSAKSLWGFTHSFIPEHAFSLLITPLLLPLWLPTTHYITPICKQSCCHPSVWACIATVTKWISGCPWMAAASIEASLNRVADLEARLPEEWQELPFCFHPVPTAVSHQTPEFIPAPLFNRYFLSVLGSDSFDTMWKQTVAWSRHKWEENGAKSPGREELTLLNSQRLNNLRVLELDETLSWWSSFLFFRY